jgi:tRNA C32,U32 (ribose-2'-O)-methylase TrmJ
MNSPALMDNLRVVLVATRNPLNIGAAARAMSNFGCTHLRLVNPYDPAYREAVSAVGAAPVLASAEQFSTVAEAVADCALVVGTTAAGRRELHHSLCTLEAGAPIILQHLALQHTARKHSEEASPASQQVGRKRSASAKITHKEIACKKIERKRAGSGKTTRAPLAAKSAAPGGENSAPNRVALLFGSEKTGLCNEDLSHCHWLLRIPTREEHRSLNLGQAVAVCLYELMRDAKAAAKFARALEKAPSATAGEVERFTAVLTEALSSSGFLDRRSVADAEERIRRLVRRLNLPSRDAEMWTGIMRQIVWKLHATEHPQPLPQSERRTRGTT